MYTPSKFNDSNILNAKSLISEFPFATVVSVSENSPVVSFLPLVLDESTCANDSTSLCLLGHLAKSNSHWKLFQKGICTVLFHGPHTYITPKWYAKNNVPTWNYVSLEAQGTVELLDSPKDIISCLIKLSRHAEKKWPSGWEFFIPEDLAGENISDAIVGFRIKVEKWQLKKKLSQNKSKEDRQGIVQGLSSRGDDQSQSISKLMQETF